MIFGAPVIGATIGSNMTRSSRERVIVPTAVITHDRSMLGFAGAF